MCTIIALRDATRDLPLWIGANRNEFFDRPASPPRVTEGDDGRASFLAPRDERAGGTWLGINERGVFVGLTNRFGPPTRSDRRSRGQLVLELLRADDAAAASEHVDAMEADLFNAFHLLAIDADGAYLAVSDGETLTTSPVAREDPHLVVLTEFGIGAAHNARKYRIYPDLRRRLEAGRLDEAALREVLEDCQPEGSIDAVCVDLHDGASYGTRSSTIIGWGGPADAEDAVMRHTDGPPCREDYQDYSPELQGLLG